jgi:hypothetical protein
MFLSLLLFVCWRPPPLLQTPLVTLPFWTFNQITSVLWTQWYNRLETRRKQGIGSSAIIRAKRQLARCDAQIHRSKQYHARRKEHTEHETG